MGHLFLISIIVFVICYNINLVINGFNGEQFVVGVLQGFPNEIFLHFGSPDGILKSINIGADIALEVLKIYFGKIKVLVK